MIKQERNRIGALVVLGVLWLLTAVGIAGTPINQPGRLLPYEHLPVWSRVALWAVPGLVALVAAVWRSWDPIAWALLIAPVAERALSFTWVWLVDLFEGGYPSAWRGVVLYAALGALIYFCAAGLDQPPGVRPWGGSDSRKGQM